MRNGRPGDHPKVVQQVMRFQSIALTMLLLAMPAPAQEKVGLPKSDSSVECSLGAADLDALKGSTAELILKNGKRVADVTLVKFVRGPNKDTVRTLLYRRPKSKRSRSFRADLLSRIIVAEKAYDLAPSGTRKSHVLVDVAEKNKVVTARLKTGGHRLWPILSAKQQAEAVREHKDFLETVRTAFPGLSLRLYETKFFLFFTDMPAAHIAGYIAQLDNMNVELGKKFGIPQGENIWRGKAVFVVFVNQASFVQFESKFMKLGPAATSRKHGICHQSGNGNVIVAGFRGDDPRLFAQVLVHETTHGYLHRFKSSARIPSWLNEGIAEWVSAVVVRSSRVPQKRQQEAVLRLKRTGVIGQSFFDKKIEAWHYGVASKITDSLIKANPRAFGSWIVSIKEGIDWTEGLRRTFGITPGQLIQAYGRSIGLPMIRLQ